MSSTIASTLSIFFIGFVLLLFSPPNATSSSTLIDNVCSSTRKYHNVTNLELCVKLLQSQPRVASATNLFDLTIEIIKSGILISNRTSEHMVSLIMNNSTNGELKEAIKDCKLAYEGVVGSLKSAVGEVEEREYQTATYDLLIASTDNIDACRSVVTSKGIKDQIILRGNQVVPIFGLSAYEAVGQLEKQ